MNKASYVYHVFETIAPGYDAANARISLGRHIGWKRYAADALLRSVPDGGHILDLCCGTGDLTALLLERNPSLHVTGLDFSPAMLERAAARFRGDPRVCLIRWDALDLPFGDDCFDGAIISFALRNTPDYARVLDQMRRVVSAGHPVCCIDSFLPQSRLIRPFYNLYFHVLMPLLGGGLRHRQEYLWLCMSTHNFISPRELSAMMDVQGFSRQTAASFMFGSCVCICALKGGEDDK